jgi:hypothetical protein
VYGTRCNERLLIDPMHNVCRHLPPSAAIRRQFSPD